MFPLMVFTSVFIAALVTATLTGSKLVDIGPVTVSVGLFIFPFTFIALDTIAEIYGKKTAQNLIKITMGIQLFVLAFVYLGGVLPASEKRDLGDAYEKMFSLSGRMVLASLTAYAVSQITDVGVFLKMSEITNKRFLWLRTNVATLCSQAIDTSVFMVIFLGGVIPWDALLKTALTAYLVKVIVAAFDTPFVYLGVHWARRYETKL